MSNALIAFLLFLLLLLAGYLIWDPSTESYVEVTPTSTSSPTASNTPSPSPTPSETPTPSSTPSPTPSDTPTPTPTPTKVNIDTDFDGFTGSDDHCPEQWGPANSADTDKPGCPVNLGGGGGSGGGSGGGGNDGGSGEESDNSDLVCWDGSTPIGGSCPPLP